MSNFARNHIWQVLNTGTDCDPIDLLE